jgi:hypothetical protein
MPPGDSRRTGSPMNVRGHHLPLIRENWHPDEVGICDALAAVWDRLDLATSHALVQLFLNSAGVTDPPSEAATIAIWRERPWKTIGDAANQRMDLVVYIHGWGTLVIEAKVSQWYWTTSGPAKLPEYARELRRRLDAGDEPGPNVALVALTPFPIGGRDLRHAEGVFMGDTTWRKVAGLLRARTSNGASVQTELLGPEIIQVLERRALDHKLEEITPVQLETLVAGFRAIDESLAPIQAWLTSLGREAGSLGLVDEEQVELLDLPATSRELRTPWVCWAAEHHGRPDAFVGVALDLENRRSIVMAGVQGWEQDPFAADLCTQFVAAKNQDDMLLVRWSPAFLELFSPTPVNAKTLDALPVAADVDWEWRGLAMILAWEGPHFGVDMLNQHLRFLQEVGPAIADAVFQSDVPRDAQRPPLEAVLATVARWGDEELPHELPLGNRPFGWTAERLVTAWMRRLTDADGKFKGKGPKRGKWAVPLTSTGIYSSREGKRCCGALIQAPSKGRRKVACAVCGDSYWGRDLRA